MGNSSSVADYITRGQLLPGPVLQTVTHSRDIKSLADNKTSSEQKGLVPPCMQHREIPEKLSEYNKCVLFLFGLFGFLPCGVNLSCSAAFEIPRSLR